MTRTLNLGILAHVDAGKTSLTERLLHDAGVIEAIGSVDAGTTQTDTLALERQRGITIKAAVVAFAIGDLHVNLIDTPGHPDFIAEVERSLGVLDGAVLVLSAVEGVQAQTRVLMRALRRLRIPTLLFVNKIDRGGADPERVLGEIATTLTPASVAMGSVRDAGTRAAAFAPFDAADDGFVERLVEALAEHDHRLLDDYVDNPAGVSPCRLRDALAAQTGRALVHPVFLGSAITGAGVEALTAGIAALLPAADGDPGAPVSGSVFKVERGPAGEKVAYVRMISGTVRARERLRFGREGEAKVTAIGVFERGGAARRGALEAGQIGTLWGLAEVRVGDAIGEAGAAADRHHFAPPALETVIVPRHAAEKHALHVALAQLAEQDPLIDLRQDDARGELYVSLYGEVQKEVIEATLAGEYGIEVQFRETTPICVERPVGTGAAAELLGKGGNPFLATIGLRVEPAPAGAGVTFRLDVDVGTIPIYVYKAVELFEEAMTGTVVETLRCGLYGWRVTDCAVTLTHCGYVPPGSTAADFRKLTPLVLMRALDQAGTVVCEPIHRFVLEIPADTFGAAASLLTRVRALPRTQELRGATYVIEGEVPAAQVHALRQGLPGATRGQGVLESELDTYQPVAGAFPTRPRSDLNPLNRKEYLLHVLRRV